MKDNTLKINPADNVAIAIEQIKKGGPIIINGERLFNAVNDIEPSHKVALIPIRSGSRIIRYGEPILEALVDINQGEWVHVHNAQPIISSTSN